MIEATASKLKLPRDPKWEARKKRILAQHRRDKRNGNVRIGTRAQRHVALRSYAEAVRTLFAVAQKENRLQELALPILYLQRHTLELLIKKLLWDAQTVKAASDEWTAKKRLPKKWPDYPQGHKLDEELLQKLKGIVEDGEPSIPPRIIRLVAAFKKLERGDESLTRYDFGLPKKTKPNKAGKKRRKPPLRLKRQSVPITTWQRLLEQIVDEDTQIRDPEDDNAPPGPLNLAEQLAELLDKIAAIENATGKARKAKFTQEDYMLMFRGFDSARTTKP